MRAKFAGYYRPNEEELKRLWQDGLFILDANVLLNLYRYPREASKDMLDAFSRIQNRLWLPYQAAIEYQENRLGVIADQVSKFDELRRVLSQSENSLRESLVAKLQLHKRHSSIAVDPFLEKIGDTFAKFVQGLDKLEKGQPGVADPDDLRDTIDKLLAENIGFPPKDQAHLDNIFEDGKKRYTERRPPGYMDDGKKDLYLYGGLSFQRQYGDLVLWEQIIEEVSSRKAKYVTFITDDEKEDWWWSVESQGKKTIGPRPELVEEIGRRSGVSLFYMYSSERFLSFSGKYLGTTVKPDTIDQVREITERASQDAMQWLETLIRNIAAGILGPGYTVQFVKLFDEESVFLIYSREFQHTLAIPRHLSQRDIRTLIVSRLTRIKEVSVSDGTDSAKTLP